MLKTLDILIGVATVMLLLSMAVTIMTQAVASLLNSRGKNLLAGIVGLLRQIDPALPETIATEIATQVLKHPLVAGPRGKLGDTVHREELTMLLLEFAAGEAPTNLTAVAQAALNGLLEKNGIADPSETLKNIRAAALQLEAANPELANDVRHGMAVLQEAKSQFIAKVHGWFDQTIDRVGDRFTLTARIITFIAALIVAITVQLDTFALIDRLSIDDQFRDAVRTRAQGLLNAAPAPSPTPAPAQTAGAGSPGANSLSGATATPLPSPTSSPTATPPGNAGGSVNTATPSPAATPTPDAAKIQQDYYNLLSEAGLVTLPGPNWAPNMALGKIPGILLSTLLLSLGAPFWYNRLQDLLRLRSVAAQKDELQRITRQTTQVVVDDTSAPLQPADAIAAIAMPGEKGDANAVG